MSTPEQYQKVSRRLEEEIDYYEFLETIYYYLNGACLMLAELQVSLIELVPVNKKQDQNKKLKLDEITARISLFKGYIALIDKTVVRIEARWDEYHKELAPAPERNALTIAAVKQLIAR